MTVKLTWNRQKEIYYFTYIINIKTYFILIDSDIYKERREIYNIKIYICTNVAE